MIATGNHSDLGFAALCNTPLRLRRGGHPERDVEGAVPYEGETNLEHKRGSGCGCFFCYVTPWKRITERSTDAQRRELFQGRAL